MNQRLKINLIGLFFVSIFSFYFAYLGQMLPKGAGPDELAHLKAAQFIYEHERLPVYPDDKDELYYSIFGATRSFRPPLIYMISAQVHHIVDKIGVTLNQPYRLANAVIGGLCALFLLLSLFIYTTRLSLAVGLSAAFMLMPQVGFIFSYLNADGIAIMACALILLSVSVLLRSQINLGSLLFFGLCCGILSLCKVTAWIFCLPICIFAIIFILRSPSSALTAFLTVFVSFAITAGWRIAFNAYHHGLDNPFNWNLDAQLNTLYASVNLDNVLNYKVQGKSYFDLLSNFDNFLSRTYLSFVGQLDWLRLRVGPLQYIFYGVLILATFLACILMILRPFLNRNYVKSDYYFELSIIGGSIFLFFMYMNFNINNDIQTQGKYVLPAFTGLLLILGSTLRVFYARNHGYRRSSSADFALFGVVMSALVYVHVHALYKYVIPFYYTQAYVETTAQNFSPIALTENGKLETGDVKLTYNTINALSYTVTGPDPRLYFKDLNLDTSPDLIHLKIQIINSKANYYYYYWDTGSGMSENTVVRGFMPAGKHTIYQILPVSSLKHLRFDLGTPGSNFTIESLEYTGLQYKPLIPWLNRLFNVNIARHSLSS